MDEDRSSDDALGLLNFGYLGRNIKYLKYNWAEYNTQKNPIF
jgi:hypothetical protein